MAEITGRIYGAYREEPGFLLDDSGTPVSITEILTMLLAGEGTVIEADNGLYLNEPNKVHLGGNIIENTTLDNPNHYVLIGRNNGTNDRAYIVQDSLGREFAVIHRNADFTSFLSCKDDQIFLSTEKLIDDRDFRLSTGDGVAYVGSGPSGEEFDLGFVVYEDQIQAVGVRTYANDAAAQADITLKVGGIYRLNADPVLRIKI